MLWHIFVPVILGSMLGILSFIWWRSIFNDGKEKIRLLFFVFNVQEYFEGLVWDLRRISRWREKEVHILVVNVGSTDDTPHILKRMEEKEFLQQISVRDANKYLQSKTSLNNWIFNLKSDTDVKEVRKCFVKIFSEITPENRKQKDLI